MSNNRLQQLFASREAVPGTAIAAGTLIAVGNAKNRIKDPKISATLEQYNREILYGSLSALETLVGKVEMDVSFAVELSGSTNGSVVPVWGIFLEACGFRQVAIGKGTISGSAFTGTAAGIAKVASHGDLWQNVGATNKYRIMHDVYTGQTTVYFESVLGTPANEAIFPVGSDNIIGPIITITGVAASAGFAWYPNSRPIITATAGAISGTGAIAAGDILKGATSGAIIQAVNAVSAATLQQFYLIDGTPTAETFNDLNQVSGSALSALATLEMPCLTLAVGQDGRIITAKGCRGTVKITGERSKPAFLEFTFKGVYQAVADGGSVPSVTYESRVPPRLQGTGFQLASYVSGEPGDVASVLTYGNMHTPRVVSFSFDMNAPAVLQEDMTQTTATGPCAYITSPRQTQGAMKIDTRPEASFPMIKKLTGSEGFATKIRINDASNNDHNVFLISAPGCKQTANSPTDTNNFQQDDIAFQFSARRPDGSDGDQRELVLSYHFAADTW